MVRPLVTAACIIALIWGAVLAQEQRLALILDLKGPIGPATSDYIHRGLEKAREQNAALVILRMDTPGGLDTSMREIIQDIISSPIPVVTYVAPSGARAASAGTYILYASHVAAMAPGTNLGAATPVQLGGSPLPFPTPKPPKDEPEEEGDGADKAEKDAEKEPDSAPPRDHPTMTDKAYIRSLALMRGRNAEWAEKAVREAASLAAEDAREADVIDIVANDIDDLLAKLDGRTVTVIDAERRLETEDLGTIEIEPDWRSQLLAVLTNPNVAYILMLIGIYGLIFEFTNPGAILPGVVGAIIMMVGEAFMPSFGALGIGGVIAFAIGSLMLFETGAEAYALSWPLVVAVALSSAAFFMLVLAMAVKARRRPVVTGTEEMIGTQGEVAGWRGSEGRVLVHGEMWQASSTAPLKRGQAVRVTALKGLMLEIEPLSESGEE
jgi:membrane-bound serine protease (ClpP class)